MNKTRYTCMTYILNGIEVDAVNFRSPRGEVPLKPTEKLKELMDIHEGLRDTFRFIRQGL